MNEEMQKIAYIIISKSKVDKFVFRCLICNSSFLGFGNGISHYLGSFC